ncbi:MAG: hypothetical protein JST26_04825 [Bacteroidetes bacterium]|nr:hypothetical protein [Bacteroidota bacterium]
MPINNANVAKSTTAGKRQMEQILNNPFPYRRITGLSLGLTASSKRKILAGDAFTKMFPTSLNTDPIINPEGTVYDTIEYCSNIVQKTRKDTTIISQLLKRQTLNETCKAIFDFSYRHIQYEIDKPGVEQLRRPARAWQDRKKGIDCDCFTIFVSSMLTNLGIPHYLRMVKMYGRDYYQHIYVVVPKSDGADMSKRSNYYVIDPVVDKYDLEAPGITETKDKKMTMQGMPIQFLNGVGNTRLGEEFEGLGDSLGETDHKRLHADFCRRCKMHLINTRNHIAAHPKQISHIYNVQGLLGAYDQLIGAWDNESSRDKMLEKLSGTEESLLQPAFQGLGDIIHGSDSELFGLINADLDGIGSLEGKKRKARKDATGSHTRKKKTGVFTKMKHAVKAAKGKGKLDLKKIARGALLKYNPAVIPIRAGFLAAMKTNVMRIASRVYWAFFSEAEAVKAGVSRSFYQKAVKGLEFIRRLFEKRLAGSFDALKKAIITGRAAKVAKKLAKKGKLNGIDELMGVSGLGVVATATVAAAMTFLTAVAGFLTKVMGKKGNEGKEETETGGETDATSSDPNEGFKQTDPGKTILRDGAEMLYNRFVNQSGGGSPAASGSGSGDGKGAADEESDHAPTAKRETRQEATNSDTTDAKANTDIIKADTAKDTQETTNTEPEKTGSGAGIVVAAVAAIALIAATSGHKKEAKETHTKEPQDLKGIANRAIKKKIQTVKLT